VSKNSKRSTSRTLKQVAKPTYYMKSLEYYLKHGFKGKKSASKNPFAKIYKEHFV
jgi:hypothetical protein